MRLPRKNLSSVPQQELQSLRQTQQTPAEAANAAMAPYDAAASALGTVADTVDAINLVKTEREYEEGKIQAVEVGVNAKTALFELENSPETKEKMIDNPEYMSQEVDKIREEALRQISEIKNEDFQKQTKGLFEARWPGVRAEALITAEQKLMDIRKDKSKANIILSIDSENPEDAEKIHNASRNHFSDTENARFDILIKDSYEDKQADTIYEGYLDALSDDKGAEFLSDLADQDIPDEVKAKTRTKIAQYHQLKSVEEAEIDQAEAQARDKRVIQYERTLDPAFSDADLNAFADSEELSRAQRRQLFTIRDSRRQASVDVRVSDPGSSGFRSALDNQTVAALTTVDDEGNLIQPSLAEQYDYQIDMLDMTLPNPDDEDKPFRIQSGAVGQNLNNHMTRLGMSEDEGDNELGLDYYRRIMEKNPLTKLDIDKDSLDYYEAAYDAAIRMGGTSEAFATAAKEQRAIHKTMAESMDTITVADSTYNQFVKPYVMEDVGDRLESMDIDIPASGLFDFNDNEFKVSPAFMSALNQNALRVSRYQQSTDGRIFRDRVSQIALQRTAAYAKPNFINVGVPLGGGEYITSTGVETYNKGKAELDIHTLTGTDTPEDAKFVKKQFMSEMDGQTVTYAGRSYVLTSDKRAPLGEDRTMLDDQFGGMAALSEAGQDGDNLYLEDIQLFTGVEPRYDPSGRFIVAEMRYMGLPIMNAENSNIITWGPDKPEKYKTPEGMTDISGGPTRADVNPRIKEFEETEEAVSF